MQNQTSGSFYLFALLKFSYLYTIKCLELEMVCKFDKNKGEDKCNAHRFSFCKIAKQNDKRAQIVTFNAFNSATVKLLYLQPEYRVICGQLFPAKKTLETCGRNKKEDKKS